MDQQSKQKHQRLQFQHQNTVSIKYELNDFPFNNFSSMELHILSWKVSPTSRLKEMYKENMFVIWFWGPEIQQFKKLQQCGM